MQPTHKHTLCPGKKETKTFLANVNSRFEITDWNLEHLGATVEVG